MRDCEDWGMKLTEITIGENLLLAVLVVAILASVTQCVSSISDCAGTIGEHRGHAVEEVQQ